MPRRISSRGRANDLKVDRLGRSFHHLVNTVGELTARGIGLKVLTGEGAPLSLGAPEASIAQ
jgi:DNA invertase Pin-like site-specific DNA recombinase